MNVDKSFPPYSTLSFYDTPQPTAFMQRVRLRCLIRLAAGGVHFDYLRTVPTLPTPR